MLLSLTTKPIKRVRKIPHPFFVSSIGTNGLESHIGLPFFPDLAGQFGAGFQGRLAGRPRITSYNVCYTKLLRDRLDSKNDECEDLGSKMWEYHNKGNNHKADYYMEKRRECTDKADSYLERWNSFKTSEPRDTYNAFCAEENSWDKEDIKAACQSSSTSFCNRHK